MKKWTRAVIPLALVALFGCGSEEDSITLYPVKGTVTQNGKPMAGATITFTPNPTNAVSTPGGDATGPEGTFSIRYRNRSGLAPGKYTVTVMPSLDTSGSKVPDAFRDDPLMAQMALGQDPAKPKKEAAGEKSEFEAEVTTNPADNVFDFDVKTKAK